MTKEERNLYIEMQPILAPFKGQWQVMDRLLTPGSKGSKVVIEVSNSRIYVAGKNPGTYSAHPTEEDKLAWLPLPIDPVNPKRGLWGMLNCIKTLYDHGIGCSFQSGYVYIHARSPAEAMLKALKAQMEDI